MAQLGLGLAKTAVEGTLSLVKKAIEEEEELKVKVQDDLVFITSEFEMMQSFLRVANKERAKNEVVQTWVRQVRTLAFDVEDQVELVIHLDVKSRFGVRALQRCWQKILYCLPPLPLDVAVAELKQIKARVEDVSQRNTRYRLISDSGSDLNSKPVTASATEHPAPVTEATLSAFHLLSDVWKDLGKWRSTGDLEKLILSSREDDAASRSSLFHGFYENLQKNSLFTGPRLRLLTSLLKRQGQDLQVISVWGCGEAVDQVTSSIFWKVQGDAEICQEFKSRAWVKLTHPFSPTEFLNNLLTQFYKTSRQANEMVSRAVPLDLHELVQMVKENKYLIFLEEVSSKAEWDAIIMHLPDSKNGSRIVVSTKHLRLALLCTGEPYQASQLCGGLSQPICAISNKIGRRSGKGELIWQISCRGVISVWGNNSQDISTIIHEVYTSIMYKSKQFEGVEFKRHSWVDVPTKFNLEAFSRRLLMNFRSEDLHQVEEIAAVEKMSCSQLTQECCRFLSEEDCLVVINGLQSKHDWDLIKDALLDKPIRGCIIVVTRKNDVATHCVNGKDGALISIQDLTADPVLRSSIKGDGARQWASSRRGRFLSIRREEAREWYHKFGRMQNFSQLIAHGGVTCLWGTDGEWKKSDTVRGHYYREILRSECSVERSCKEHKAMASSTAETFTMFSWVVVQQPFNLTAFSRRLLLDFHSDDLKAKRIAAVDLMEGRQDPIQECRKILRSDKCLVAIDGLHTKGEWDEIKKAFLSELNKGCIIVTTNEYSVATYVSEKDQPFRGSWEKVDRLLIKGCAPRLFSHRSVEARDWANRFPLIGSQAESAYHLADNRMDPGVTAVWGIPGTGKSTLVRSMYSHKMLGLWQTLEHPTRDDLVINHIRSSPAFTVYGWVDVPCPFNLMELSRRLLLDFLSDDLQAKEAAAVGIVEGEDPIHSCRTIMHQRRCLVVIDGLCSTDDWDLIKAAFLMDTAINKPCVLVVTSEQSVATYCADDKSRVVNVKCLEAGPALNLFKNILGGRELTPHEMKFSEGVMAKCGGIMKVIAAIGKYLLVHGSKKDFLNSTDYEFMGMLERDAEFHTLKGLFAWMQAYFDACSDSLKPCIFYMSIFPAKHNIRRRRLLRRWVAEGYCRDTSDKVTEENWERLFDELVKLSIIQLINGVAVFQVNNSFFREYTMSRPMEDNLVFALESNCGLDSQQAGRHLTIRNSWDRDKIVFEDMDFSRLRSLTVFGGWTSLLISKKMKVLRVLDLEDASTIENDDLEQIGKRLPCLKFLSLRGHEEITRLPDSVGSLRQLQTLDVRRTSVTTLPPTILKLHKLQYVRAGTTLTSGEGDATATMVSSLLSKFCKCGRGNNGGVTVPSKIGNLTALQTLGVLNVNVADGKAVLKGIKELTQLRRLGISGINRRCWLEFCSAISGHGHLESLSMKVVEDKKGLFARFNDISQPPKALKCLKVYGYVQILPAWMSQLPNVDRGNYGLTILTQQDINDISEMPGSHIFNRLYVKPNQERDQLSFISTPANAEKGYYCQIVEIECTSELLVTFGDMSASAEVLKVHCSSGSSLRISGLNKLSNLKEVWLKGSYVDDLKRDLQRQIEQHPDKPLLKLEEPRSS